MVDATNEIKCGPKDEKEGQELDYSNMTYKTYVQGRLQNLKNAVNASSSKISTETKVFNEVPTLQDLY